MRSYLTYILLCLISINDSWADFILSPGVELTSTMKSEEKEGNSNLLKGDVGFGFVGSMEWRLISPLSFGIGLGYSSRTGHSLFQNQDVTLTDLQTTISQFNAEAGIKLRIINTRKVKLFIGGGISIGSMALTFDKDDFIDRTHSLIGFESGETKGYQGHYFDAGIEYIINNKNALRFSAKHQQIETDDFENLNNQSVSLSNTSFSIQYMHYVSWSFFVK